MGIGVIIPGFSFSSLCVMLNIYDPLLKSFNNLFKDFKSSFKFLLPLVSGVFLSCLILFYPISLLLNKFPFLLIMCFSGLFLGGNISLFKKIKNKDLSISLISFLLIILINNYINSAFTIDLCILNFNTFLMILLLSSILGMAVISIGLSITFILLNFSLYDVLLDFISKTIRLDFSYFNNPFFVINILSLMILTFGFVLLFSKCIYYFLHKYTSKTIAFFLGTSIATVINIFLDFPFHENGFKSINGLCYYYIVSLVLFFISLILISKVNRVRS